MSCDSGREFEETVVVETTMEGGGEKCTRRVVVEEWCSWWSLWCAKCRYKLV